MQIYFGIVRVKYSKLSDINLTLGPSRAYYVYWECFILSALIMCLGYNITMYSILPILIAVIIINKATA